jgi:hypothetical protein
VGFLFCGAGERIDGRRSFRQRPPACIRRDFVADVIWYSRPSKSAAAFAGRGRPKSGRADSWAAGSKILAKILELWRADETS